MPAIVEYQIETPGGDVVYRSARRSVDWIRAQAAAADRARSAGDLAGAAKMATQLLQCLGEIAVAERPDDFWQLATRLQAMVDEAEQGTELQQTMLPALEGQLSLF